MTWTSSGRPPATFASGAAAALATALGLDRRRGMVFAAATNSVTFTTVGTVAPTLTSPTGATAQPAIGTRMYVRLSTAAVKDSVASLASAMGDCRPQHRPRLRVLFRTDSAISMRRFWAAITDSTMDAVALRNSADGAAASTRDFVGIGFDTAIGTDLKIASGDGTNYTCVNTGLVVAADTEYLLDIDYSVSGVCTYRVTVGGVVHTFTKATNLPVTTTTNMGPAISLTTLEDAQKDLDLSRYDFEVN